MKTAPLAPLFIAPPDFSKFQKVSEEDLDKILNKLLGYYGLKNILEKTESLT